jgi:AraC family transcriptional regulator
MVIWHPADLVHENNFINNGHNLNLVIGPEWLEGLPPDISVPDNARSWEGGLAYRIGLELYRSLNQDALISQESVVNLISLCASSKRAHGRTRWLPLILEWMNDEYSCTLTLSQASEQAGVHPVHVSRSFRRTLGCTFHDAPYLTWQGRLIEGKGVDPSVVVQQPPEQLLAGEDPQMQRALEVASGL